MNAQRARSTTTMHRNRAVAQPSCHTTTRTMETCPQCDLPMVWSDTKRRRWCCVYGDHPTINRLWKLHTVTPIATHMPDRSR